MDERSHVSDSESHEAADDQPSNDTEDSDSVSEAGTDTDLGPANTEWIDGDAAPEDSSDTASEADTDDELEPSDNEWIDDEQEELQDLEHILEDDDQGPSVDELVEEAIAKSPPSHHEEIRAARPAEPSLAEIVDQAIAQVMTPSTDASTGSKRKRATPVLDRAPANSTTGTKTKRATPVLDEAPVDNTTGTKTKRAARKVSGTRHSPVSTSRTRVRPPTRKHPWTLKELARYNSISLGGKMKSLSAAERAKCEAAFDDGMTRVIETRCQQAQATDPEVPDAAVSMVFRKWMVSEGPKEIFEMVRNATTQDRRIVLGSMFLGLTSFEDLP